MTKVSIAIAAMAMMAIAACNKKEDNRTAIEGKEVYLDLSDTVGVYYDGISRTETDRKIALGRVLFYDTHLSLNNAVSCAGCHKQQYAFADNVAFSRGFEGRLTGRNSPAIQDLFIGNPFIPANRINFDTKPLFWDGRQTNLKTMVMQPVNNHIEMGIADINDLPAKLNTLPYYQGLAKDAYGKEGLTTDNIAESMAWFLFSIQSGNSRFERYRMQEEMLSNQELWGMNLFDTKYGCGDCHRAFTGYQGGEMAANIGLDAVTKDRGAGATTGQPSLEGAFLVPNLGNVALTAPYMHDGRFKTLEDVVDHYNNNIQPNSNLDPRLKDATGKPLRMNISEVEKAAIVAFLHTLTDYSITTKSVYSNPFKTR